MSFGLSLVYSFIKHAGEEDTWLGGPGVASCVSGADATKQAWRSTVLCAVRRCLGAVEEAEGRRRVGACVQV